MRDLGWPPLLVASEEPVRHEHQARAYAAGVHVLPVFGANALAAGSSYGEVLVAASGDSGDRVVALRRWAASWEVISETRVDRAPCSLALSPDRSWAAVACYAEGTVGMLAMGSKSISSIATLRLSGTTGPDPVRQDASHPHQVLFDRAGRLLVTDLGSDEIVTLRSDPTAARIEILHRAPAPPGSGPRHLVEAPPSMVLVANELSATVDRYARDPNTGHLEWAQSTLVGDPGSDYPSEIVVLPGGELAVVAIRGTNRLVLIELQNLNITGEISTPRWPQHLTLASGQLFVACRDDNVIVSATIDGPRTIHAGFTRRVAVPRPTWIMPEARR